MDKCWLKAIFVVVKKCCKDRKHPISLFVIENASFIVCCERKISENLTLEDN